MVVGWDVTQIGSAHSALAGVLAAVVLVMMPITARDAVDAGRGARRDVARLLVLAFVALILAAIVWGSLNGQPDLTELRALSEDKEEAQLTRNLVVGCVGVILLATGALCVLAGLIEYVAHLQQQQVAADYEVAATLLAGLALYEALYFYFMALDVTDLRSGVRANTYAVAVSVLVMLLLLARTRQAQNKWPQLRHLGLPSVAPEFKRVMLGARWTIGLAVGPYVLAPLPDPIAGPGGQGFFDWASLVVLAGAVVAFGYYAFTLARYVAGPTPDDQAQADRGERAQTEP